MSTPSSFAIALVRPPVPDFSIARLLTSNSLPSRRQAQLVQQALNTAEAHLHLLYREICHIRQVLDYHLDSQQTIAKIQYFKTFFRRLVDHYEEWRIHLQQHRSVFSISRRIPDDVLSEIFAHCAADDGKSLHADQPPWTLGRVSQQWRLVSLSTPNMWSTFSVDFLAFPRDRPDMLRAAIQATKRFLTRSRRAPLRIVIKAGISHPILDALAEHSDKWEHVSVAHSGFDKYYGEVSDGVDAFGAMANVGLARLRHLSVYGSYSAIHPALAQAPLLTSLAMTGAEVAPLNYDPRTAFTFPVENITKLKIEATLQTTAAMLGCFVNVQDLVIQEPCHTPSALLSSPLLLQHLVSLDMQPQCTQLMFLTELIVNLRVPSLAHLRIQADSYYDRQFMWPMNYDRMAPTQTPFQLFMSRVQSLVSLSITGITLIDTQVVEILAACPSVTTLELTTTFSSEIIQRMTVNFASPTLVPKLKNLVMRGSIHRDVLDMIVSRAASTSSAVAPMERVVMYPTEPFDFYDRNRIWAMKRDGSIFDLQVRG